MSLGSTSQSSLNSSLRTGSRSSKSDTLFFNFTTLSFPSSKTHIVTIELGAKLSARSQLNTTRRVKFNTFANFGAGYRR
ncbi:1391_t:CDS:2 [Funneliformis caledonium]|uniref:1391_t:CDS:1 n=1 Tax=Funneliformis caledonium TaxID=1117310 RepID=A0A9N9EK79_9GLOM|nr:1391_t:CDS:2 [Funneliformis caledonium]